MRTENTAPRTRLYHFNSTMIEDHLHNFLQALDRSSPCPCLPPYPSSLAPKGLEGPPRASEGFRRPQRPRQTYVRTYVRTDGQIDGWTTDRMDRRKTDRMGGRTTDGIDRRTDGHIQFLPYKTTYHFIWGVIKNYKNTARQGSR